MALTTPPDIAGQASDTGLRPPHTVENRYQQEYNVAIKFYPELQHVRLKISSLTTGDFAYTCIPNMLSLFTRTRQYRIGIALKVKEDPFLLFANLPFEARVGVLSHELAHAVDYERRSILNLIKVGVGYGFERTRAAFERSIDELAIAHGAGEYLLKYYTYAHSFAAISSNSRHYMQRYYLHPNQIVALMHGKYRHIYAAQAEGNRFSFGSAA